MAELSTKAKIGHLLLVVIAATIACFLTAVLADGRSVIVLKEDAASLPIITNPAIISANMKMIVGTDYGVGLHHDMAGRFWSDVDPNFGTLPQLLALMGAADVLAALPMVIAENVVKHPVAFLECNGLVSAGTFCCALAFIGIVLSVVAIIVSFCGATELISQKCAKMLSIGLYSVFTIAFLIVTILGLQIVNAEWACENPVIPTLTLADSFDLSYGIPFAIIGIVASVIGVIVAALMLESNQKVYIVNAK